MPSKRKANRRRRRRNKNKYYNHTSRTTNPQQFAKDQEKFHKARLKAHCEYKERIQIETRLNESKALQCAQVEKDNEYIAYLTNLPFSTSAKEIVNWLTNTYLISIKNTTSQSIMSCEIIKHMKGPYIGSSSGKAYVQFSSKYAFQHVQNLSQTTGLELDNRQIYFIKGYRQDNYRDQRTTKSFHLSKVQVGHSVDLDNRSR